MKICNNIILYFNSYNFSALLFSMKDTKMLMMGKFMKNNDNDNNVDNNSNNKNNNNNNAEDCIKWNMPHNQKDTRMTMKFHLNGIDQIFFVDITF